MPHVTIRTFRVTEDIDNLSYDRRFRYGARAMRTVRRGQLISVEETWAVAVDGSKCRTGASYSIVGMGGVGTAGVDAVVLPHKSRQLFDRLAEMDPGVEIKASTLSELAAADGVRPEQYAHTAILGLLAEGVLTLDQVREARDRRRRAGSK